MPAERANVGERPADATMGAHLGEGRQLPRLDRSLAETKLGANFGRVRIHTDPESGLLAGGLGARAFTHGNHIVFGAREWNPQSTSGQNLLSHELFHVAYGGDRVYRAPRDVNKAINDATRGDDVSAEASADLVEVRASTLSAEDSSAVMTALLDGLDRVLNGKDPDAAAAATYVLRRIGGAQPSDTFNGVPPRFIRSSSTTTAANRTMRLETKLSKDARVNPIKHQQLSRFPELGEHFFANFVHYYPKIGAGNDLLDRYVISTPGDLERIQAEMARVRMFVKKDMLPVGSMTKPEYEALEKAIGLASFHAVADTLNVEGSGSARYASVGGAFKCNVYATDFTDMHVSGAYFPKQWYANPNRILDRYTSADEVSMAKNRVVLMTPPTLNNWLRTWGPMYGWSSAAGAGPEEQERAAQADADAGKLVVFTTKTCVDVDENGDCKEPTGGEGHSGLVAPQGSEANQQFNENKSVGKRFTRSQAGEVQIRQGSGRGLNIFNGGHFDGGFWVYSPSDDDSTGKPTVAR